MKLCLYFLFVFYGLLGAAAVVADGSNHHAETENHVYDSIYWSDADSGRQVSGLERLK